MKIEIIKTKESDGDWFKVIVDNRTEACVNINNRTEEEALKRAFEIFDFIAENKGKQQVIKSVEL
jgi:hypothetical protein